RGDDEQDEHLGACDAEERPEEERVEPGEDAVVEADEEEPECERERAYGTRCRRLGAETAPRPCGSREGERAEPADAEVPDGDRDAGEACRRRTRKGRHRQR